ncbi:MAG: hypothetical protein RLZZ401_641, partial [Pseudomonadota bacterium]
STEDDLLASLMRFTQLRRRVQAHTVPAQALA